MVFKIHQPSLHPALLASTATGDVVTILRDNQLRGFIKQAANNTITEGMLRAFKPTADRLYIHLVGLGDEETYGPNKNADGYPKSANVKYHPTFLTHAGFYQEHLNKGPNRKVIGEVKLAKYNEKMARVELVVELHRERAEREFEMAMAGEKLSFSMGASVPYDVCNICKHAAKNPSHYCSHMKRPLQWNDEHQKFAYVSNPIVTFKDISEVKDPADRIAHYLDYVVSNDHLKVASASRGVITGSDLARVYNVADSDQFSLDSLVKLSHLRKLSDLEQQGRHNPTSPIANFLKVASTSGPGETALTLAQVEALRSVDPGVLTHKLALRKTLLPFSTFAAYLGGMAEDDVLTDPGYKLACDTCMDDLFTELLDTHDAQISEQLEPADPLVAACSPGNDTLQTVLDLLEHKHTCDENKSTPRIMLMQITVNKKASGEGPAVKDPDWYKVAARFYGHYKLSFCNTVADMFGSNTLTDQFCALIVAQK